MKLFTITDLNRGSGIWDYELNLSGLFEGRNVSMTMGEAIGLVASATKSGLTIKEMDSAFKKLFSDEKELLRTIRSNFLGGDPRLHLWREKDDRLIITAYSLNRYCQPRWHVERRGSFDAMGGWGSAGGACDEASTPF